MTGTPSQQSQGEKGTLRCPRSGKRMEIITVAILAFAAVDGVERIPGVVVGRHPIELLQPSRRLTHECSPATDCGQPIPLGRPERVRELHRRCHLGAT